MFPDASLASLLLLFTEDATFAIKYRLYKNNYTPVVGTLKDFSQFTESTFPGYASITGIDEPDPAINGSHEAHVDGDELTWTRAAGAGSAEQAFGMFITYHHPVSGNEELLCALLFDEPTTIAFAGDKVRKKVNLFAKNYVP